MLVRSKDLAGALPLR